MNSQIFQITEPPVFAVYRGAVVGSGYARRLRFVVFDKNEEGVICFGLAYAGGRLIRTDSDPYFLGYVELLEEAERLYGVHISGGATERQPRLS